MREIKFRAWDIYSKPNKMVYPNNGDFIGWHAPSNWKDCYKIMQFTGLKDKNGKEIYEGDIIEIHQGNYHLHWWVEFSEIHAGFVRKWRRDSKDFFPTVHTVFRTDIISVAGNIYENPELIR